MLFPEREDAARQRLGDGLLACALGELSVLQRIGNIADLDEDGTVGILDLLTLLANWG